jgi:hypothetical protein
LSDAPADIGGGTAASAVCDRIGFPGCWSGGSGTTVMVTLGQRIYPIFVPCSMFFPSLIGGIDRPD